MFGAALCKPLAAQMMDWAQVPLVATVRDRTGPGGHPAFGLPPDLTRLWDSNLHFGLTETARGHGGYLEEALEASERPSNEMEKYSDIEDALCV